MKKAFTLIELLIVVAVLVTLMGLMFKLGAVGGDSYRRTRTITRMQKLENCLSGYNAAFGSYPPVKLHASRNINSRIDNYGHGMQTGESGEPNWNDEGLAWDQVQAACLAQPVACRFPFPDGPYNELIRGISTEMKRRAGQSGNEHYRKYWGNERIKKKLEAGFESVNMNAGGAAFYEGHSVNPSTADMGQWINAVLNDTDPCVLPEQALVVTQILEAIYTSAKTGQPVYFD